MKKQATYGNYSISIAANNSVSVICQGEVCKNAKAALREIADQVGYSYEKAWNTQQFGSKLVDFLNINFAQASASKSNPNKSQKQHIRVEVTIEEHDYVAFDTDENIVDESFAFNGDCPPESVRVYVDGIEIDFDEDALGDRGEYSAYQSFDLEQKWDYESPSSFGYYQNRELKVWEFDVENFDIDKLHFYYECFDVIFDWVDYESEEHRITLRYDGKEIDETECDSESGSFEQIWSEYDEDDDDEDDDDDEEEVTVEDKIKEDAFIEITPNTVIDDIYVAFTLRYPHLHLRFLSESGVMDALIDSSKTVAEIRKEFKKKLGKDYEIESGSISIKGDKTIEDLCQEFRDYGFPSPWVCCYYSNWFDPEPHGSDRTLSFANNNSKEDAQYMIAGLRNIDTNGNIIEEDLKQLSTQFGILSFVLVDLDDEIREEEMIAVINACKSWCKLDADIVKRSFIMEKMGIRNYDKHSDIVKSVEAKYRGAFYKTLIDVAISDFHLSDDKQNVLMTIANMWDLEEDRVSDTINLYVEILREGNPNREFEWD